MHEESTLHGVAPYRDEKILTCPCGHDKDHMMVSPVGDYTTMGWFMLLLGISAKPIAVRFTCRRCDKVIAQTEDPSEIGAIRMF